MNTPKRHQFNSFHTAFLFILFRNYFRHRVH